MKIIGFSYLARSLLIVLALNTGACMQTQTFDQSFAAYESKDFGTALAGFKKLAEHGDSKAQYYVGVMHHNGQGVSRDEQQAMTWYRKAAEKGNADAQHTLGAMYQIGQGVPKDDQQAMTWYRKAAEQGNADAQFKLAVLYLAGQDVPKDDQQAVTWYRKAADQGHTVAQSTLGAMYAFGKGVPKDNQMAYFWLLLASAQGSQSTVDARDVVARDLSPDQRAATQAAVRNWKPKNAAPYAPVSGTAKDPELPNNTAQPIPATTILDAKAIALCAAETNTVKRLACFDEVASANGLAPKNKDTSTTSSGKWQTSTDSDPLTDKAVHYASLNTDEGNDRSGKPFQMTVRCQNTRTEVFISWRTFLGTRGLEVTTRIDKSPALTSYWSVSTDNVASFMPQPVTTLKKFEGASRFLVNLTPYGEGPITAVFDISGSREAFNDIRRDCKW